MLAWPRPRDTFAIVSSIAVLTEGSLIAIVYNNGFIGSTNKTVTEPLKLWSTLIIVQSTNQCSFRMIWNLGQISKFVFSTRAKDTSSLFTLSDYKHHCLNITHTVIHIKSLTWFSLARYVNVTTPSCFSLALQKSDVKKRFASSWQCGSYCQVWA